MWKIHATGLVMTSTVIFGGAAMLAMTTNCGAINGVEPPTEKAAGALAMGTSCPCPEPGQPDGAFVQTDQGQGRCLDGAAVTDAFFNSKYPDPNFPYTICQDPRVDAGPGGTGGTAGAGGTGGSGGDAGVNVCLIKDQRACTTNETQHCDCSTEMVNGAQTCNALCDGWTTCAGCIPAGTGGTGGTAGTGGGDAGPVSYCLDSAARACTTNQTQLKQCGGDVTVVQTCLEDCSAWTNPDCPDAGVGGTGGTGGTAGTGGGDAGPVSYCLDAAARACTTNQTQVKQCGGDVTVVQTCLEDCSGWTNPDCPDAGVGGTGGTGGTAGTGGGDAGPVSYCLDAAARACTTNQTQTCYCPGDNGTNSGAQSCNALCDGWTTCECADAGTGGTGGDAGVDAPLPICQDPDQRACTTDQVNMACTAPGGVPGTQSCLENCSGWTPCVATDGGVALVCNPGGACLEGYAECQVCHETSLGMDFSCQKGAMISVNVPWDPACTYPDGGDAAVNLGLAACETYGDAAGNPVVILMTTDTAPDPSKTLGAYGKLDDGAYTLWDQATTGQQLLVITMTDAPASPRLAFNPGWALPNNTDFSNWNPLCPDTGCSENLTIHACKGKAWLGTVNGTTTPTNNPLVGTIGTQSGPYNNSEVFAAYE
ncbi:MAG: hypothetical protein WCT54_00805 [Patescibacteria group bacterium]